MAISESFTGYAAARPSMIKRAVAMLAVARQRRALAKLDAAQLEDIGVTPAQAMSEANLPAWDVPANWRL